MAYLTSLKYCLDLPRVNGGCRHWLRSESNIGVTRHRPESQVRQDSEIIGFFVLREQWIGEVEEKQLQYIPRKRARCYGCRTNFIVIWEKYAHIINWPSIVDGRYSETFFNSYDYLLIQDFKLADGQYNKAISAAATKDAINPPSPKEKQAINPPPPEDSADATGSEVSGDGAETSTVEKRHAGPSSPYFFPHSSDYLYTPDRVDSDISLS